MNVGRNKRDIGNAGRVDVKSSDWVTWCLMLWVTMGLLCSVTACNWGGSLRNTTGVCIQIFPGLHSAEAVKHL